jgi:PadR family transcriptional regulator AphA
MAELTATSYTILGWLDLQAWPTYELAKQIRRNLRFFWPRAESQLYEEPRRLVKLGLASAEQTHVGKRPRTIYSITPEGRRALAEWMDESSQPPMLWFDGLVRLFFGNSGTPEGLLLALVAAKERADEIQTAGAIVANEYLSG